MAKKKQPNHNVLEIGEVTRWLGRKAETNDRRPLFWVKKTKTCRARLNGKKKKKGNGPGMTKTENNVSPNWGKWALRSGKEEGRLRCKECGGRARAVMGHLKKNDIKRGRGTKGTQQGGCPRHPVHVNFKARRH